MLCYYKETFTLGVFSAFVVFSMAVLFEDVIGGWVEGVRKLFSFGKGINANS